MCREKSAVVLDYSTVVVEVVGTPSLYVDVVCTSGGRCLLCGSYPSVVALKGFDVFLVPAYQVA